MRISLLQEREPFESIFESTLKSYLHSLGHECEVTWSPSKARGNDETLLVNRYLNTIFDRRLAAESFDPIRREFSHSLVAWRRPLQSLYVSLAIAPKTSRLLSHASVRVSPTIDELSKKLIVPGNRRIRILDHEQSNCVSILKAGFRNDGFQAAIEARQLGTQLGLNIPALNETSQTSFTENYISATPLNRIPDADRAEEAQKAALSQIQHMVEQTSNTESLDDYAQSLAALIAERLSPYNHHNPKTVAATTQVVQFLQDQIENTGQRNFVRAHAHGDFQPANILIDENRVWLIDWENAGRKQAGYDWLVFATNSRRGRGLAKRLDQLRTTNPPPAWTHLDLQDHGKHNQQLATFLLEEIAVKANEVCHPAIPKLSTDFQTLIDEAAIWHKTNVKPTRDQASHV